MRDKIDKIDKIEKEKDDMGVTTAGTKRGKRVSKEAAGTNLIQHRGYVGKVEYDDEAGIFHGEIIGLNDVITFHGESVKELRKEMGTSVDEYLAFCKEIGREPEKPYSGKFVVRVNPELHRVLVVCARSEDLSLNRWVSKTLEEAIAQGC